MDNFNRSQFISRTVVPADKPRICVCTAPATPTVHKSEFEMFIDGEMADGGGDFKVVTESENEFTVLLVVESVTIVSAYADMKHINAKTTKMNFLFICTSILLTFGTKNDIITINYLYLLLKAPSHEKTTSVIDDF